MYVHIYTYDMYMYIYIYASPPPKTYIFWLQCLDERIRCQMFCFTRHAEQNSMIDIDTCVESITHMFVSPMKVVGAD